MLFRYEQIIQGILLVKRLEGFYLWWLIHTEILKNIESAYFLKAELQPWGIYGLLHNPQHTVSPL